MIKWGKNCLIWKIIFITKKVTNDCTEECYCSAGVIDCQTNADVCVDECVAGTHTCGKYAICTDKDGGLGEPGFTCTCEYGYSLDIVDNSCTKNG